MGDPKRIRKKYDTPSHPWIKSRIDEEKRLKKSFGTKSKKEIWKIDTKLKNFKSQAKKLIALNTPQAKVEQEHLFRRVKELGLINSDVSFDKILGLTQDDMMARRLQTVVYKKGLAKTTKQARQFIVHEHILIDNKKVTSPSYIVSVKEEALVSFAVSSSLFSEDHAERASPEKLAEVRAKKEELAAAEIAAAAKKAEKEAKAKAEGEEALITDEEAAEVEEEIEAEVEKVEGDKE